VKWKGGGVKGGAWWGGSGVRGELGVAPKAGGWGETTYGGREGESEECVGTTMMSVGVCVEEKGTCRTGGVVCGIFGVCWQWQSMIGKGSGVVWCGEGAGMM